MSIGPTPYSKIALTRDQQNDLNDHNNLSSDVTIFDETRRLCWFFYNKLFQYECEEIKDYITTTKIPSEWPKSLAGRKATPLAQHGKSEIPKELTDA